MRAFILFLLCIFALSPAWAQPPKRILMVMTSNEQLYGTGKKTGFWFDELATPYYAFEKAGFDVTLVSVKGGQPPADPRSMQAATAAVHRFLDDKKAMGRLSQTLPFTDIKESDFDAVFLVGGHGVMWDFSDNALLADMLRRFDAHHKIIAAIDHAPLALATVMKDDNTPLVKGRKLTAFTREEEKAWGLDTVMPNFADRSLEGAGATVSRAKPFQPNVAADGNLLTGQNPASAAPLARRVVAAVLANRP